MKTLSKIAINLFLALFIGSTFGMIGVDPLPAAGAVFAAGLTIPHIQGALMGGIQVEIWEDFIAKNLFKDYPWLRRSKNRDGNVLMGKIVYIPQAGAKPTVVRNRTSFPVTVTKRDDTVILYEIDEFSTDGIHIPDADKIELSYDKISDVLEDHMMSLDEEVAKWAAYNWNASVSANIIRSTGSTSTSYLSGTTGNRKDFLPADLASAKTKLNTQTKKEQGERVAVMGEDAYNQIKNHSTLQSLDNHAALGAVFRDGDLVRLHGFDIVRTDANTRYTNAGTPVRKQPGATVATSDNDSILCYDTRYVHFAKGSHKFFENLDDASYQGDVYSANVRAGSSKERTAEEGVISIVQEP